MPAAGFAFHLFDRAGEVEIDHVKAGLGKNRRRLGHRRGVAAHQLSGDGVIFLTEIDAFFQTQTAVEKYDIQHGFGDRIGTAAAACDGAHGAVAVAGEAGLAEGRSKLDGANLHSSFL